MDYPEGIRYGMRDKSLWYTVWDDGEGNNLCWWAARLLAIYKARAKRGEKVNCSISRKSREHSPRVCSFRMFRAGWRGFRWASGLQAAHG